MKVSLRKMEVELSDFRTFNIGIKKCHICGGIMWPFQGISTNEAFYDNKPCHDNCYLPDAQYKRHQKLREGGYQPEGDGKVGKPPTGGSGVPSSCIKDIARLRENNEEDWKWAEKRFRNIDSTKILILPNGWDHKVGNMKPKLRTSKEQMKGPILYEPLEEHTCAFGGNIRLPETSRKRIEPLPPVDPLGMNPRRN